MQTDQPARVLASWSETSVDVRTYFYLFTGMCYLIEEPREAKVVQEGRNGFFGGVMSSEGTYGAIRGFNEGKMI